MKTTVHTFNFDTRDTEQRLAWETLRDSLKASHPHCMESWGGGSHYRPELDGLEIELESKHLFDNQWNTAPIPGVSDKGLRLFDWALDAPAGLGRKEIKRGHYLDQTPEMHEARRNTVACGYCGRQEAAQRGSVFCGECIDSPHLKETELHLTRMRPVDTGFTVNRAPLTEAERAHLLPRYREAQIHGTTERGKAAAIRRRESVAKKYEAAIRHATAERDGFTWALDHGVNTENLIYYSHTGRFCFGWREKLGADVAARLLELISEFPFPYTLECADGRKLEGN